MAENGHIFAPYSEPITGIFICPSRENSPQNVPAGAGPQTAPADHRINNVFALKSVANDENEATQPVFPEAEAKTT